MENIELEETRKIIGGASTVTGTVINYLTNLVKAFYSFGQAVGGGARRLITKNACPCSK